MPNSKRETRPCEAGCVNSECERKFEKIFKTLFGNGDGERALSTRIILLEKSFKRLEESIGRRFGRLEKAIFGLYALLGTFAVAAVIEWIKG